jgi:RNA polymerase sigma-70 factor (ECF subfamily)
MNKDAFARLFQNHQNPLYRYLHRMSGSKEVAEELLQETFYRAMLSLRAEDAEYIRAWLYRVARNLYIDWLRKQKAEQTMIERAESHYLGVSGSYVPEEELARSEQRERVRRLLLRLPERMRTILYLREMEEFTYEELAHTMQLNLNTLKVTLHRAREKFRELEKEKRE